MTRQRLTPGEIHKITNRLSRMKATYQQNSIHEDSVSVVIEENGDIYLEWVEDQGGPYLQRVPCSTFVLRIAN